MKVRSITLLIGACLLCATTTLAGQACEARVLSVPQVERALRLAQRTAEALDAEQARSGTRVVLLARAGQDLTRWGQQYSHIGWAHLDDAGHWRVVHKLNACGTAVSVIMRQGLGEFFMDDVWRDEAAWVAVPAALQQPLSALLRDARRVLALHEPRYSVLSYAWGTRYQQSNQWAVETLALAAEPGVVRREQAQAWLRLKDYRPTILHIDAMTRLGGRLTRASVAFDDHPGVQRFADRIETVTADSVLQWLPRALGASPARRVAL